MRKILFSIFLFSIFLLTPSSYIFAESNSGFLSDSIWYSEKDFQEGDTIEIHTAIWNSENVKLEGSVEFLDGTTILGTRSFSIEPNTLENIHISWKVTAGDHAISTRIKDAFTTSNGLIKNFTFADKEQSLPKITISKKIDHPLVTDDFAKSVSEKINDTLPSNIAEPVSTGLTSLDTLRANTNDSIQVLLEKANKKIEVLNQEEVNSESKESTKQSDQTQSGSTTKGDVAKKPLSGTEKPIAYVELFLLSVASFIFRNAVVFYGLCAVLLFIVIRFIYRKIRG